MKTNRQKRILRKKALQWAGCVSGFLFAGWCAFYALLMAACWFEDYPIVPRGTILVALIITAVWAFKEAHKDFRKTQKKDIIIP